MSESGELEEVAHLALALGRLLLTNGAETEAVYSAVERFAAAFGCEAQIVVGYEALIATIVAGESFRTKIGHRLPGLNIGLTTVEALNELVERAGRGLSLADARAALEAIEQQKAAYGRWIVVAALGLTAAALSRLFGGDWGTFVIAGLAGAAGTWPRLELGARRYNPVLIAFAVALLGGIVGAVGVKLGASGTPALCLVAPAMILVPGVPLINGVQDMMRGHATLGMSRLGFALLLVAAIALGLFGATALTGVRIPVDAPTIAIGVPQDVLFSALAAAGYAVLFGVPLRMAWACLACGVASHSLRALLFHAGVDIVAGTLVGALAAGLLAAGFARRFAAPAATFAFPGVVAMIPGAYAFRAVIGSLQIMHGGASPALVADTFGLAVEVAMMVSAIAVGIAAPSLLTHTTAPRPGR